MSEFSCIWTMYGDLWRNKSPYSVQMRENTDQKKLCIWTLFAKCMEHGQSKENLQIKREWF